MIGNLELMGEAFLDNFYNSKYPLYIIDKNNYLLFVNKYLEDRFFNCLGMKCFNVFYKRTEPCENCPYKKVINYNDIVIESSKMKENILNVDRKCINMVSFPITYKEFSAGMVIEYDNTRENLKFVEKKNQIYALKDKIKINKEIEKEKNLYYRNLAHELGKSIENIEKITEQLKIKYSALKKDEYMECVEHLISRSNDSIKKMLKFNEINQSQSKLLNEKFQFKDIINEVRKIYNVISKNRNIKFSINVAENARKVYIGDKYKILQVIRNVLDNAFNFTINGFIKMNIYEIEDNIENSAINISIKDSGIGIPEEQIESVYKEYYKIDNKLSNSFGKAGLGLAISKNLVDSMNGSLSILSELGEGTTVNINIMLKNENKVKKDNYSTSNKTKVLVIGVNELFKYILKMKMRKNYEIEKVLNGEVGLLRYYKFKPDIVLIDMMCEGLNGFDFYDQVYKNNTHSAAIIATSNKILSSEEEYLMSYGFDAYIPKPIDYHKLVETLENVKKGDKNE